MRSLLALLAPLLRLLPSPKSGSGFLGYLLFVLAPVAGALTLLGHVDLVTEKIDWIEYALEQWWGYPVLWAFGLLLLLYAGYKQQSGQHAHVEGAAPGSADSRSAQELERFRSENKQLRAQIPQPNDEDLKRRCCELSAEIFDFYKRQRENLDNALESGYGTHLLKEPERSQWRSEETERHEKWMVDRYIERFGGVVSALGDDLEQRGWCTPEERKRFENPTGPQMVQHAALRLDAICRKSGGS